MVFLINSISASPVIKIDGYTGEKGVGFVIYGSKRWLVRRRGGRGVATDHGTMSNSQWAERR